jgi:N-acetylgalactosamine-6-sulfatase
MIGRIASFSRHTAMKTLLFALSSLVILQASFAAENKPNIVFLFADDFGWGDLGCYGHPYARTPNIDKLSTEGTKFMQYYATGVTCCPSRTGFMTSWLPARYPTYPANGGFADRVTITELLHNNGYHTGHFGKWHIGPNEKPGTYGIEETPGSRAAGKEHDERGRDAMIYDDAIQFIETHKDGPFYLNVWDHIPHHPIDPPKKYLDEFKDLVIDESKFSAPMQEKFAICRQQDPDVAAHIRAYLAEVKSMDDDVGRFLAKLDALGLRENTIVVFSSDQGPAPMRAADEGNPKKVARAKAKGVEDLRLNSMGSTGILRGGKFAMHEGGVRIPFIIRWPGHVPAGRVDEKSVCSLVDWLPTICQITGTSLPRIEFDGEDVSAAWLGKETHVRTKPLLWKTSAPGSDAGIREGQWKLMIPTRKNGIALALYDINSDPAESRNVAAEHPDIVTKLRAPLEAWVATLPKAYVKTKDKDE